MYHSTMTLRNGRNVPRSMIGVLGRWAGYTVLLIALAALWGRTASAAGSGEDRKTIENESDSEKDEPRARKTIPLSVAKVLIEVNETDGDSGFHISCDGGGWKSMTLYGPKTMVVNIKASGGARKTGLTELFIESAEPGFEDLPLAEFLKRFPAGVYRFVGETIDGDLLVGQHTLTHILPFAPTLLAPAKDSVQDPSNTVIKWELPSQPVGGSIVRYEVIVIDLTSVPKRVFSAVVPASVKSMNVPAQFLMPKQSYTFEVIAIEAGGNQTLAESRFTTAAAAPKPRQNTEALNQK